MAIIGSDNKDDYDDDDFLLSEEQPVKGTLQRYKNSLCRSGNEKRTDVEN